VLRLCSDLTSECLPKIFLVLLRVQRETSRLEPVRKGLETYHQAGLQIDPERFTVFRVQGGDVKGVQDIHL